MSKVKIVQISVTSNETDTYSEYLDDQGRVWYQIREYQEGNYKYVWKQLDLPEEPQDV